MPWHLNRWLPDPECGVAFLPGYIAAEADVLLENFDYPFGNFAGSKNLVYKGAELALTFLPISFVV